MGRQHHIYETQNGHIFTLSRILAISLLFPCPSSDCERVLFLETCPHISSQWLGNSLLLQPPQQGPPPCHTHHTFHPQPDTPRSSPIGKSWHASIIRLACIWSSVVSLANQKNCANMFNSVMPFNTAPLSCQSPSLTLQHHDLLGFPRKPFIFSQLNVFSPFASSPLPLPLAALPLLP